MVLTEILIILCKLGIIFALENNPEEYCVGEYFNPSCPDNEMILMTSALYGQMLLGKCIKRDVGFLGCQADALSQFDRECSGKSSCKIQVFGQQIEAHGGCPDEISKYLSVSYSCVKNGIAKDVICDTSETSRIIVKEKRSYLSSGQLKLICTPNKKNWIITAESGQNMNISVVHLSHTPGPYGSLIDLVTNRRVVVGDGPREKHLFTSAGNEIKIVLPSGEETIHFLLDITLFGFPNLTPPIGAWMTRNDDTMEVGCHSGEKKWTMHCINNQWVGAVGQCGKSAGILKSDVSVFDETQATDHLTLNSIIFAACSVIIFLSSLIFIVGVCLYQRQQAYENQPLPSDDTLIEYMIGPSNDVRFSTSQKNKT